MAIKKPIGEQNPRVRAEIHGTHHLGRVGRIASRLVNEAVLGESIRRRAGDRPDRVAGGGPAAALANGPIRRRPGHVRLGAESQIPLPNSLVGDRQGFFCLVEQAGDNVAITGSDAAAGTSRSHFDGGELNNPVFDQKPGLFFLARTKEAGWGKPAGVADAEHPHLEPPGTGDGEAETTGRAGKGPPRLPAQTVDEDDQGAGHRGAVGGRLDAASPFLGRKPTGGDGQKQKGEPHP